jgi:hypothetical protein
MGRSEGDMSARAKAKFKIPGFLKADARLIGTWKSDRKRTFAEWNWKKDTPPKKRKLLKSFFGKCEITYTRNRVVKRIPQRDFETSQRYAVLATDEASVAILVFGGLEIKNRRKYWLGGVEIVEEMMSKPEIVHVHFCKEHFWISVGNGRCREFYRRIRPR